MSPMREYSATGFGASMISRFLTVTLFAWAVVAQAGGASNVPAAAPVVQPQSVSCDECQESRDSWQALYEGGQLQGTLTNLEWPPNFDVAIPLNTACWSFVLPEMTRKFPGGCAADGHDFCGDCEYGKISISAKAITPPVVDCRTGAKGRIELIFTLRNPDFPQVPKFLFRVEADVEWGTHLRFHPNYPFRGVVLPGGPYLVNDFDTNIDWFDATLIHHQVEQYCLWIHR
jgi:hypothetical protein